jgi:hypothetical protein
MLRSDSLLIDTPMHDDTTPDLFGHIPPAASDGTSLKSVAVKAKASPLQREFDRLVQRIEQAQALLTRWKEQPQVIMEKYHSKMEPTLLELAETQKSMIVQLDAFLVSPPKGLRMTARRRNALMQCLFDLLDAVAHATDDTLLSIRERYGVSTAAQSEFENEEEEQEAQKAEIIAIFEQFFGKGSIEPHPEESHEAFVQRAQAGLQEAMEAEERREEEQRQRRAEKRAKKRGESKRGADAQAGHSEPTPDGVPPKADLLRTLYRKLASSIHPDREHDPTEKARKTESMQGLNTAYQNKDLLALLKLHNATLQDGNTLESTADDTLREYNLLLKSQLKAIEANISRAIDEVLPSGIAMTHGRPKRPEQLESLMEQDIQRIARVAQGMRNTLRDLNDPKRRNEAVNGIVEMVESSNELDEIERMMEDMMLSR